MFKEETVLSLREERGRWRERSEENKHFARDAVAADNEGQRKLRLRETATVFLRLQPPSPKSQKVGQQP